MASENRGSIVFSTTYRPPLPLDIFSCPIPTISKNDEVHMTDGGESYNYNGQAIPPEALKSILKRPIFASQGNHYNEADVDSGRLSGMVFVSERGDKQLETLHIAICFVDDNTSTTTPKVKVFSLAEIFPDTDKFNGVRMEDSGCIAGNHLIYVSTKEPAPDRRQPWTAVYKMDLITGKTKRLTPKGMADLSPSVSLSGKMIAVASLQRKDGGWDGEIENLDTNIFVMNVEGPLNRRMIIRNGGWPTWGSDNVIFFHRKVGNRWGVFRANISWSLASNFSRIISDTPRVTPDDIDAMTPAAIDTSTVAVATIRQKSHFNDVRAAAQYRHIEIFHSSGQNESIKITQITRPKIDHFNPFVIDGHAGNKRIGYHRCKPGHMKKAYTKYQA